MSAELIVLFLLYPLVGICTICTLARYQMHVATVAYTVAFLVLFLFLPVYTGNDLLRQVLADYSVVSSSGFFWNATWVVFQSVTPYLSLTFFIAILISVFLCLSAISVAITAIRVVRKLRKRREPYRIVSVYSVRKIGICRRVPKSYKFCHAFCRYNC